MLSRSVQVPVSLSLDQHLLPSARLVWVVLRLHAPQGPTRLALLQSCIGLSRPTVRRALTRLAAAGWHTAIPGQPSAAVGCAPADARVTLPGALVADQRVGVQARILYGVLQVTPGFRNQGGQFAYAQLSGLLGVSRNTVKRAVCELVQARWLQISQRHQLAPVCFTLGNPEIARSEAEVARAQQRLNRAAYLGETLMREYLSLIVDSDRFEDDAAPGFLVNPFTDERLQLDRYYTQLGVAFEYNGPQHYHAAIRSHIQARPDVSSARDAVPPFRVLKPDVPSATAGGRFDGAGQLAVLLLQRRQRFVAPVPGIDVQDHRAGALASGDSNAGSWPSPPPLPDHCRVRRGVTLPPPDMGVLARAGTISPAAGARISAAPHRVKWHHRPAVCCVPKGSLQNAVLSRSGHCFDRPR